MGKGKLAVQASHAAVSACEVTRRKEPTWFKNWLNTGHKKIAVKVANEEELRALEYRVMQAKLPYAVINDAGRTQLPPGTTTAMGIGPAPSSKFEPLTDHLKLF